MKHLARLSTCLMLSVPLTACALNSIDLPPPPPMSAATLYRLDTGDTVSVEVYGQPDLSGRFAVGADGLLALPLTGTVVARGKTIDQVAAAIRRLLARSYIVNPQVTVAIAAYRPIYILGEVNQAGSFPYQPGLLVRQAVALAGGFNRRAISSEVEVTRVTPKGVRHYAEGLDGVLQPGDTINVHRRLF
jgi:polysaccharide export outer membrane protein